MLGMSSLALLQTCPCIRAELTRRAEVAGSQEIRVKFFPTDGDHLGPNRAVGLALRKSNSMASTLPRRSWLYRARPLVEILDLFVVQSRASCTEFVDRHKHASRLCGASSSTWRG